MSQFPLPRSYSRMLRQVVLACVFVVSSAVFAQFFPKRDSISRVSIGTAYAALLLAGLALMIGPWNLLRSRPNPVSFNLRRDVGIWAGIAAIFHTAVGLNVHLRGQPWLYFVDEHYHLRTGMFGFGNEIGLVAALLFLMLLAISNDFSLRRLGTVKWKSLQRWTYVAAVLTAAHAVAYQNVEKRTLPFRILLYAVCAGILALQIAGVRTRLKHALIKKYELIDRAQ
jgi:methionine sulfoxide reductase heme-binding subunit